MVHRLNYAITLHKLQVKSWVGALMSSLIAPTGRLNLVHMNFDDYGIDFSDAWINNI